MTKHEEWLLERKKGIGSSDAQHLLETGKYGCRRFLEIEKSGIYDLPELESTAAERGKFFEPIVASLIEEKTGRKLQTVEAKSLEKYPHIRGNADRIAGETLIEIKTANSHVFRDVKRNGPSEGYISQVRWLMMVYGLNRGELWYYWPDGHELLSFTVERDEAWETNARHKAGNIWQVIESIKAIGGNTAEALLAPIKDESFAGCNNCRARNFCHKTPKFQEKEIQLSQEISEKLEKYFELTPELEELDGLVSELKEDIKKYMLDNGASKASNQGGSVSVYTQARESLDSKVKEILTDEQKAKYIKKIEIPTMRITKSKGVKK